MASQVLSGASLALRMATSPLAASVASYVSRVPLIPKRRGEGRRR